MRVSARLFVLVTKRGTVNIKSCDSALASGSNIYNYWLCCRTGNETGYPDINVFSGYPDFAGLEPGVQKKKIQSAEIFRKVLINYFKPIHYTINKNVVQIANYLFNLAITWSHTCS